MTMEEARLVVLQRAVALLVASADRNRLHALMQEIADPEDAPEIARATREFAAMVEGAAAPRAGRRLRWTRR